MTKINKHLQDNFINYELESGYSILNYILKLNTCQVVTKVV